MTYEPLFDKYLDGTLTVEERTALKTLLATDPGAGHDLVRFVTETSLLIETIVQMETARAESIPGPFVGRRRFEWRVLAPLAAAAAMLIGLGVFWFAGEKGPVSTPASFMALSELKGEVVLVRSGSSRGAQAGMRLETGDVLRTGEGMTAIVIFGGEDSRVALGENTELALGTRVGGTAVPVGKSMRLACGRLTATVAEQAPGKPFVVETPQARLTVVGTKFEVRVSEQETRLEVTDGIVRLTRLSDGASTEVCAGYGAVASEGFDLEVYPALKAAGRLLLHYDFEDGRLPSKATGQVVAGPPRAGNRFVVVGVFSEGEGGVFKVRFEGGDDGLFRVGTEPLVLSFDYWVDNKAASLDVFSWNSTQQKAFGCVVYDVVRGRWTRQSIPLSELQVGGMSARPGDALSTLTIQTGQRDARLYVDNIEVRIEGGTDPAALPR